MPPFHFLQRAFSLLTFSLRLSIVNMPQPELCLFPSPTQGPKQAIAETYLLGQWIRPVLKWLWWDGRKQMRPGQQQSLCLGPFLAAGNVQLMPGLAPFPVGRLSPQTLQTSFPVGSYTASPCSICDLTAWLLTPSLPRHLMPPLCCISQHWLCSQSPRPSATHRLSMMGWLAQHYSPLETSPTGKMCLDSSIQTVYLCCKDWVIVFSKVFRDPSCSVSAQLLRLCQRMWLALVLFSRSSPWLKVSQLPCVLYFLPLNSSMEVLGREIAK